VLLSGSSLAHAQSLPQGGSVALGNAAIHGGGNAITVDQTSQRAVVNWDSFSVGQGAAVTFNQPNAGAAILNRVIGATASTIAGAVSGNGQMFLVNPNGIAITASGTVTMGGGFVASTLDISDRDFAQGTLGFNGSGSGTVSNSGAISVGSGGFAALLGGRVASSGIIAAPLGRIGLGSGRQATLDLTGDGFLQVALPAPASGDDPLVAMAGRLSGARIELRAATVSDAIRNAVNVPGELAAQGAHAEGGVVVLDGGAGGAVRLAGGVEASGATQGGAITLTGKDISLESGAKLTATGGSAGGTILVGGGLHGEDDLLQATSVTMAAGSSIDVSATGDGHGGTAVLWSNVADAASQTRFAGTIRARARAPGRGHGRNLGPSDRQRGRAGRCRGAAGRGRHMADRSGGQHHRSGYRQQLCRLAQRRHRCAQFCDGRHHLAKRGQPDQGLGGQCHADPAGWQCRGQFADHPDRCHDHLHQQCAQSGAVDALQHHGARRDDLHHRIDHHHQWRPCLDGGGGRPCNYGTG
jgi:filamentous hemagglutinin family protein